MTGVSNRGPRVDVMAPGSGIMGPISQTSSPSNSANQENYTLDNSFKVNKLSGTSMAAPQVTGVVACLVGLRHSSKATVTKEEVKSFIVDNAESSRLYDPTSGNPANDYDNSRALHGTSNKFLKQPFNSSTAFAHGTTNTHNLPSN